MIDYDRMVRTWGRFGLYLSGFGNRNLKPRILQRNYKVPFFLRKPGCLVFPKEGSDG